VKNWGGAKLVGIGEGGRGFLGAVLGEQLRTELGGEK